MAKWALHRLFRHPVPPRFHTNSRERHRQDVRVLVGICELDLYSHDHYHKDELASPPHLTLTMSCPSCIQGFILPGKPTGSIQPDFHNAYFAPAPNGEPSKRAVLLFTDIFGLPLRNPMIMADTMAKELGCDVWVPDYFKGASHFCRFSENVVLTVSRQAPYTPYHNGS